MKIGYARVSTRWYQSEVQIAQLEAEGCSRIWRETGQEDMSAFLEELSENDTVIATRLASVAHSLPELVFFLEQIQTRNAHFRSLAEPWADTRIAGGAHLLRTLRGVADFEFELAGLRRTDSLDRPQTVGITKGRPAALSEEERRHALSLLRIGKSAAEVGRHLGVSRSTISRLKSALR